MRFLQNNGTSVSLSQVATLEYGFEEGVIWHRDRLPSVTVRADIYGKHQAVDVVREILPQLQGVRDSLPDGYLLDVGGTVRRFDAWPAFRGCRHAIVFIGGVVVIDDPVTQFLTLGDGFPYRTSGLDWCDLVFTAV